MIWVYAEFAEKWMAMPVIMGHKSETERFAGSIGYLDNRGDDAGWESPSVWNLSFLGPELCEGFDVQFATKEGKQEYVGQLHGEFLPV